MLCNNLPLSKPQFAEAFRKITQAINEIKDLKFVDLKYNANFARKQQSLIEKCEKVDIVKSQTELQRIVYRIKSILTTLKTTIQRGDAQLEEERRKRQELSILKKSKYDEHVMFTQAKKRRDMEGETLRIAQVRHKMFDALIAYVTRKVATDLGQVLYTNKRDFTEVFLNPNTSPQFELSVCFDEEGKVNVTPTFEEHFANFSRLFNSLEKAILRSNSIEELQTINNMRI